MDWDHQMEKISAEEFVSEVVPFWNAVIYVVGLYMLGVGFWKSVLIMIIASICVVLNYGGRWILRGGFGLIVLTTLVFIGALPPPENWLD